MEHVFQISDTNIPIPCKDNFKTDVFGTLVGISVIQYTKMARKLPS